MSSNMKLPKRNQNIFYAEIIGKIQYKLKKSIGITEGNRLYKECIAALQKLQKRSFLINTQSEDRSILQVNRN